MIERYLRKAATVDAVQFLGTRASIVEILQWAGAAGNFVVYVNLGQFGLAVGTQAGNKLMSTGDWIVRDAAGQFSVLSAAELVAGYDKEALP